MPTGKHLNMENNSFVRNGALEIKKKGGNNLFKWKKKIDCCLVPIALLIRRACARNTGSHLFHIVMGKDKWWQIFLKLSACWILVTCEMEYESLFYFNTIRLGDRNLFFRSLLGNFLRLRF